MVTLEELLRVMIERGASDLHISAGSPPRIRVDGLLAPTEFEMLDAEASQRIVYSILDDTQISKFEQEHELDVSFGIAGIGRFRTNVYMQRGATGAAIRVIPYEIATFADLGLPKDVFERVCAIPKGLLLVTGSTGSGKSTTQAAMIDHINSHLQSHIMTIEDPIEFVHRNKNCLINQREVGTDTMGFTAALKHVVRQDPDIILLGEMRDLETIEAALTIAETGHLTIATLHTSDAVQTINRVIDVFPATRQSQVRTQLSFVLEAVFCQQLLPLASGRGRVLACEVMMSNEAVRALIRDDKVHQVYSVIQTSAKLGMQTMNHAMYTLYRQGKITYNTAMSYTSNPDELRRLMQRSA